MHTMENYIYTFDSIFTDNATNYYVCLTKQNKLTYSVNGHLYKYIFFLQNCDAVSWIWAFPITLHLDVSLALLPFPVWYHSPICAVFCHYYGLSLVVTITVICLFMIRLIAYLCVRHALSLQTCRTFNDLVFDLTTSAPFTQFYLQHFLLHGTVRDSIYALLDRAHVIYTPPVGFPCLDF